MGDNGKPTKVYYTLTNGIDEWDMILWREKPICVIQSQTK